MIKELKSEQIRISNGNPKCQIKSISFTPCATCDPSSPCFYKCYARKAYRLYKQTREAYDFNVEFYKKNPREFERQLTALTSIEAFFRYFVSGDIIDAEFFALMVRVAKKNKNCKYLAFTKKYDIVNNYLLSGKKIPKNLKIIFSLWGDYGINKNPFKLPQSNVIFKGQETPKNAILCGGNCVNCICRGCGCWQLKNGQTVYFNEH